MCSKSADALKATVLCDGARNQSSPDREILDSLGLCVKYYRADWKWQNHNSGWREGPASARVLAGQMGYGDSFLLPSARLLRQQQIYVVFWTTLFKKWKGKKTSDWLWSRHVDALRETEPRMMLYYREVLLVSESMSLDIGFTSLIASVISHSQKEEEAPGTKMYALSHFFSAATRRKHSTHQASSAAQKAAAHHFCCDL